jgi:hypothetical protein
MAAVRLPIRAAQGALGAAGGAAGSGPGAPDTARAAPSAAAAAELLAPPAAGPAAQTDLLYRIKKRKTRRAVSKTIVEQWFDRLTGGRAG